MGSVNVPWPMLRLLALITAVVVGLAAALVAGLVMLRARRVPGRVVAGSALALGVVLVGSGLLWYSVTTTPPENQAAPVPTSVGLYTVLAGSHGPVRLVALRARDAAVSWQRTESGDPIRLAAANGVVYTATENSSVLPGFLMEAVQADDGRTLWSTRIEEPAPVPRQELQVLADPVVAEGRVFVYVTFSIAPTPSAEVVALDAATGSIIWRHAPGSAIGDILATNGTLQALDAGDGRVFAGSSDGSVVALDQRSGSLLWRTAAAAGVTGQEDTTLPLLHGGVLYVYHPARYDLLTALRPSDGSALWRFPATAGGIIIDGPPAFSPDDATMYVVASLAQQTARAYLLAISSAHLAVQWQYFLDNAADGSPAVAGDVVFAGTADALYAIRAVDGHVLWHTGNFERVSYAYPVVADGVIFALASNSLPVITPCGLHCGVEVLYALRASDGSTYWRYPVTYPSPVAVADSG